MRKKDGKNLIVVDSETAEILGEYKPKKRDIYKMPGVSDRFIILFTDNEADKDVAITTKLRRVLAEMNRNNILSLSASRKESLSKILNIKTETIRIMLFRALKHDVLIKTKENVYFVNPFLCCKCSINKAHQLQIKYSELRTALDTRERDRQRAAKSAKSKSILKETKGLLND